VRGTGKYNKDSIDPTFPVHKSEFTVDFQLSFNDDWQSLS